MKMRHVAPLLIYLIALTVCNAGVAAENRLRIATFNIAMGLPEQGQLGKNLVSGQEFRLQQVAEILQRIRPDIIVLNEFDYDPDHDAANLINQNYLDKSWNGQPAIQYPYSFRAPVNTGVDSGLDLDGTGNTGEPQDAWGFGTYPGQYGMLVLSRYPIILEAARTFQLFPWSALPAAKRPLNPDGSHYYPDEIWQQLRLSSKSHWDLPIDVNGHELHLLVHHPSPPVFDGPEDRNGMRNFDENRFWVEYLSGDGRKFIVDDKGVAGGLKTGASFVIAGDLNADPKDGDSIHEISYEGSTTEGSAGQILDLPQINASCTPSSIGGQEASLAQGGKNSQQRGNPALDTSDFNDEYTGNLRLDFVLPSTDITVHDCGVFWPAKGEAGYDLVDASDHRLVWLDISL
jgi:endonuclease/exonuclease/phosphatase family metal-dependent hydrolase